MTNRYVAGNPSEQTVVDDELRLRETVSEKSEITPREAKCIRIALAFGDPANEDCADDELERAKAKLLAIEKKGPR